MRGRTILLLSLGLNIGLATGWYWARHTRLPALPALTGAVTAAATNAPPQIKILPLVRKQFFSWNEIESADYGQYVANLRDIGCPEQTIRDIIVADVDALYARQRAATNLTDAQLGALASEQRGLLMRLLGADWEMAAVESNQPRVPLPLDGPILGALSDETKAAVQEIAARTLAKIQAHDRSRHAAGQTADSAEVARLEQAERTELAGLLTPAQLDEFLLRFSANAGALREQLNQLKFFNATADEFRNLFHATDNLDLQIKLLGASDDPAVQSQRQALQQQREFALKNALGPQRYAVFANLQDPAYRAAVAQAQETGGTAQTVQALYAANGAAAVQQSLVDANSNLTGLQKQIELKKIELAQLQAQAQATGQTAPETPPLPGSVANVTTQPHIIQPGENLAALARNFSTKISDIQIVNPGVDFHSLKPGDTINLPVIEPLPPPLPAP